MARHNDTGKLGEGLAKVWAIENGYKVIFQNWRHGHWEIDLITTKDERLHFFEIKTRRTTKFGYPEELVDRKKLNFFISAGTEYIRLNPQYRWIQFNILSITLNEEKASEYFLIADVYY